MNSLIAVDLRIGVMVGFWTILTVIGAYQLMGLSVDNYAYYRFFNDMNLGHDFLSSRFEFGYQIWTWVAKFVFRLNFQGFLLTIIATSLGIKFYMIWRYTSMPILGMLAYIAGFYFIHEYTQFRAAVGIAFAIVAVHRHIEKRLALAGLFYLLALMFHYSSIMVPLVVVASFFMRRWYTIGLLVAVGLILAFVLPVISRELISVLSVVNPLTESYVYGDRDGSASVVSVPNLALTLASLYAIAIGYLERSTYHRTFLVIGMAGLAGLVVMSGTIILATRIKELLLIGFLFAFTRSKPDLKDWPPILLMLFANFYTLWRGAGFLYEF